jgi:hypothetical protein
MGVPTFRSRLTSGRYYSIRKGQYEAELLAEPLGISGENSYDES